MPPIAHTIIWCAHIRHVVREDFEAVCEVLDSKTTGFVWFSVLLDGNAQPTKRLLNVAQISSCEALIDPNHLPPKGAA